VTRGRFITFEGTEGVGKSTQIRRFVARARAAGIDVIETREPGGTENAEKIREILKAHTTEVMPPVAELLLMFAARAINVENTIRPAIERGQWVVADRFTDSTRAYQGAGRGVSAERIDALADWVHGDLDPDITVLLDAPVEVGLSRAGRRGASDRFEAEQRDFFERVHVHYRALADASPDRFRVIDASGSLETVGTTIDALVDELIINTK